MIFATPRRVASASALLLLAFVTAVPFAAANVDVDIAEVACPLLPLWDATWCWVGVTFNFANAVYRFVTCDVIGGPFCGLQVCDIVCIMATA